MKVEVADRKNMYSMCVATIVDVIGDRLRMRYDGLDDDVAEDFWCHYQSAEIHPIGWSSLVGHTLQPPIGECMSWCHDEVQNHSLFVRKARMMRENYTPFQGV